jgi:hypothetical protein
MSMFWTFSSNCNISPLLVITLLTLRMVYVLSSIFKYSSSSLVFEFRNLIISLSSVGISPNSPFILSITYLLLITSSFFSNMICTIGQISFMDLEISIQIFSFTSARVFPATVFFCSYCNSCFIFSDVCFSML